MPSKKKTKKGPRKKAAKADKKEGENEKEADCIKIGKDAEDEDAFLEEAIKLAAAEKKELKAAAEKKETMKYSVIYGGNKCCNHGFFASSLEEHNRCEVFAATYLEVLFADGPKDWAFHEGAAATEKIFPGVWRNTEKLELIQSYFLSHGADAVLDGDIKMARFDAFAAIYLEQWIDDFLDGTRKVTVPAKLVELLRADEHTLVSFFRKCIPCSYLDAKHKEVKMIKKMGWCNNHLQPSWWNG